MQTDLPVDHAQFDPVDEVAELLGITRAEVLRALEADSTERYPSRPSLAPHCAQRPELLRPLKHLLPRVGP